MSHEELIPFLKESDLTNDLSEEEIKSILPYVELKTFEKDEVLFKEGDEGRELYLVKSGNLEVFRDITDPAHSQLLGLIAPGDFFGEMAHLEGEKRSASVSAVERAELIIINLDEMQKNKDLAIPYAKIIAQVAKRVSSHLRRTDKSLIEFLKEKLERAQVFAHTSNTLMHFIVLMAVWFNLAEIIEKFPLYRETLDLIFTATLLLLFGLSAFWIVRKSGYPLEFYGLTLNKWFLHSIEAVFYTLPFMFIFLIIKWIVITHIEPFKHIPLFATEWEMESTVALIVTYAVFAPLQEFIARGCLQSCFRNFFQGPHRAFQAILISTLLFEVLHTVKDFSVAVSSLILSFFWGYLYEKQKSIVGVSLSHAILGVWAFFVLDYDTLLDLGRQLYNVNSL